MQNISFAPADFRRFEPLLEEQAPRVMATVAAPPDEQGWCSLSLHAGGTAKELARAAADPQRLLVVEVSPRFPRTYGLPPEHPHAVHVDQIDILVESEAEPFALPEPEPDQTAEAIATNARAFIPDGSTLQTGIGAIPSAIVDRLAAGDGGDYGVHSEMFTNGLMALHEAGKVSNRKGQFDGVSVATFAGGSAELYGWLDGNDEVAFLPVELVNSPDLIARNRQMVTINAAMAVDIHGQVIADTIHGAQYSGIGGHEDFVAGPALALEDRSLLCMPSTVTIDGVVRSRIVPWFEAGRRDHDPAPPGRRDRHRARRRRASGPDRPRTRDGARRDRRPGLPRRAAGSCRSGLEGPRRRGRRAAPAAAGSYLDFARGPGPRLRPRTRARLGSRARSRRRGSLAGRPRRASRLERPAERRSRRGNLLADHGLGQHRDLLGEKAGHPLLVRRIARASFAVSESPTLWAKVSIAV